MDYSKCETCNKSCARPESTKPSRYRKLLPHAAIFVTVLILLALNNRPALAQYATLYGSGINADALNNVRLGPWGLQADYRFLANHTGTVSKVHFYMISSSAKSGYSAGNGGKVHVQLETDDGTSSHRPSGHVLGSYTISSPIGDFFPSVSLSPAPKLTAGVLYHLVFTNSGYDPSANYVSVDDLYMYHPLNPMQAMFSNLDCATLIRTSSENWYVYAYNTPIFQIAYTDGHTMGQGYMEVWPEVPQLIGGSHAVRETFTVTGGTKTVASYGIRVARTGGSAPLTVRLEMANGTLVQEGYIPASAIPLSSSSSPKYVWATDKFPVIRTLYSGDGYHLDLEASSGTTYQVFPIRKGSAYGFANTSYFCDGYAQFKSGPHWVGWTQWGVSNRTDADLQFYFAP